MAVGSNSCKLPHKVTVLVNAIMTATIIVAATVSNGIGIVEGATARLPWRLSKEMAYFVQATTAAPMGKQNSVIMGRRTWESIPPKFRPLKDRLNIVLSRDGEIHEALRTGVGNRVQPHKSLLDALKSSSESSYRKFIIGGATIYAEALQMRTDKAEPMINRILLTRILSPAFEDCNVYFPDILKPDPSCCWKQSSHQELVDWLGFEVPEKVQEDKGIRYEFQMWIRTTTLAAAYVVDVCCIEHTDTLFSSRMRSHHKEA